MQKGTARTIHAGYALYFISFQLKTRGSVATVGVVHENCVLLFLEITAIS